LITSSSKLLKILTEQAVATPYRTCEGVYVEPLGFKNIGTGNL